MPPSNTKSGRDASRTRFGGACYGARHWPEPDAASGRLLPAGAAQGLADLLPILLCGEESAERAFALAAAALPQSLRRYLGPLLLSIAEDERRHGVYLASLRSQLPPPGDRGQARRAAHFLRQLASDDLRIRLARIAALDAGVCHVLAEVCRPATPVSQAPALARLFGRIRSDEGRHVRICRHSIVMLQVDPRAAGIERYRVTREFAALLESSGRAFEALGVDLHRVLARLQRLGDPAHPLPAAAT